MNPSGLAPEPNAPFAQPQNNVFLHSVPLPLQQQIPQQQHFVYVQQPVPVAFQQQLQGGTPFFRMPPPFHGARFDQVYAPMPEMQAAGLPLPDWCVNPDSARYADLMVHHLQQQASQHPTAHSVALPPDGVLQTHVLQLLPIAQKYAQSPPLPMVASPMQKSTRVKKLLSIVDPHTLENLMADAQHENELRRKQQEEIAIANGWRPELIESLAVPSGTAPIQNQSSTHKLPREGLRSRLRRMLKKPKAITAASFSTQDVMLHTAGESALKPTVKTDTEIDESSENTVTKVLQEQDSHTQTTAATMDLLGETSPELVRYGNLHVLAKLLSRKFSPQAVEICVKEDGPKLVFAGTNEEKSSMKAWLADTSNELICRPYVISHPLMACLLNQPSHSDLINQVERKCDCLILPASDYVDLAFAEKLLSQSQLKLPNGNMLKIVVLNGDLSRQNVDVILKPIFRASDFADLRNSFSQHANTFIQTDTTLLVEPGLLLCKRVLYALFGDTVWATVSRRKADSRFFPMCFEAIRFLGAQTLAIPIDSFCGTNDFSGDVNCLQSKLVDALSARKLAKLKLKEVRLVTSSGLQTISSSATATKLKAPQAASNPCVSLQSPAASGRPLNPTVLNLANGVTVRLIQDDIANVSADVLVSSTGEGKRDLAAGGASCKSIFAAGGADFAKQVKACYPEGLPSGADCKATSGRYGSLKCTYVAHVALPARPLFGTTAEQTIKAKAVACLTEACQCRSIAFPVIGAGGLGYPAHVVAKGLLDAASRWSLTAGTASLKDIHFVVHTSDRASMQAFQALFRIHTLQAERCATPGAFKLGSVEIKLDSPKADVGEQLLLLASSQNDAKFGSEWIERLLNALICADNCRVKSVVIPIQKGALEAITPTYLADLFFSACVKFEATSPNYLRTLRPYLENAGASQAFVARVTDLVNRREENESESWRRGCVSAVIIGILGCFSLLLSVLAIFVVIGTICYWQFRSSKSAETLFRQLDEMEAKLVSFGINKPNPPSSAVRLKDFRGVQSPGDYVIYGKADGIAKAVGMLNEIQTPLTKDSVQDLRFERISKVFTQTLTSNSDFCIASKPGAATAAVFMSWIGHALAELTLLSLPPQQPNDVAWYLQTPDSSWHPFGKKEAAALESLAKVAHQPKRDVYFASFDFDRSVVTVGNSTLSMTRRETDDIPLHWISNDHDAGHLMVALAPHSPEYKDIRDFLKLTSSMQRQVILIQRIENRPLFRQYLLQKANIAKNCPVGHVVERNLFHGTAEKHLGGICGDGFDPSRAGRSVGAEYGSGSYFSTSFDYSSHPRFAREGHVLYCKVLVGESVRGSRGLKVLPYKPGSPGVKYDSAVDDLQNPSMFVIFAENNAFPAYLITLAKAN